jgi:hypothetical protein
MSKEALSKITEKLASRIRAWRQTGVTRTLEREATDCTIAGKRSILLQ